MSFDGSPQALPVALNGLPRVAFGGRWNTLQEENSVLTAEIRASQEEVSWAGVELEAARRRNREVNDEATTLQSAFYESTLTSSMLTGELATMRCALGDASEAGAAAAQRAAERKYALEALESENMTLRSDIAVAQEAASRSELLAAAAEIRAAQERSGRHEAEACAENLTAKLSASEARLANRATHVDLLLRDKERLWAQLSRARRRSAGATVGEAGVSTSRIRQGKLAADRDAVVNSQSPSGTSRLRYHGKPTAVTMGQRTVLSASSASREAQKGSAAPPGGHEREVAELQRQLWHMRRALERERVSHEQTREALLLLRGGKGLGSTSTLVGTQVEERQDEQHHYVEEEEDQEKEAEAGVLNALMCHTGAGVAGFAGCGLGAEGGA